MPAGHPLPVGATEIFSPARWVEHAHRTPLTDEQTRWNLADGRIPPHLENRIVEFRSILFNPSPFIL